ncbi:MAG: class I SAM-dependent methyltransferase, partial [Thermodesulfovibrionia bacterium]|nr:class I SAM-dependent methyltransferase [Thermodesulfovibrionia bacterium]
PVLAELTRHTYLKEVHPRMISGHIMGGFLQLFSQLLSPSRILEIGTFTGYSAICLAKGLAPGGTLVTMDNDEEILPFAREYIERSGLADIIQMVSGDASKFIPGPPEHYDLVYIDGEKSEYIDYYELVLPKLKKDGIILVDNVIWSGKVVKTLEPDDHSTRGILDFNKHVREDNRVEQVIMAVEDGIMLIRKL